MLMSSNSSSSSSVQSSMSSKISLEKSMDTSKPEMVAEQHEAKMEQLKNDLKEAETKQIAPQNEFKPREYLFDDSKTIYVSNISEHNSDQVNDKKLREIFEGKCTVQKISLKKSKFGYSFAYVVIEEADKLEQVIKTIQGSDLDGKKLKVERKMNKIPPKAYSSQKHNDVKCYRCNRFGHFARDCRENVEYKSGEKRRETSEKKRQSSKPLEKKPRFQKKEEEEKGKRRKREDSSDVHKKKRRRRSSESSESDRKKKKERKNRNRSRSRNQKKNHSNKRRHCSGSRSSSSDSSSSYSSSSSSNSSEYDRRRRVNKRKHKKDTRNKHRKHRRSDSSNSSE